MNFGQALHLIKHGKRVMRTGWNGAGMFIFLVPGSTFKVNRPPLWGIYPEGTSIDYHAHIDMKTAQGYVVPWVASHADILSDDWVEIRKADLPAPGTLVPLADVDDHWKDSQVRAIVTDLNVAATSGSIDPPPEIPE